MATPPARTEISDTYPNPSNAVARVGFGKLWDTLFGAGGLLGSTGDAAGARVALGIGPVISNRNRLINGSFSVNQRGISGSVVLAAGVYGHDRWKAGAGGCSYTFAPLGNDFVLTITAGSLIQVIEGANVEGGPYAMSWFGTSTGKIGAGATGASGVTGTATAGANLNVEFGLGTLTRVQLEPGVTGTPFERRPIGLELSLSKRYYQEVLAVARGTLANAGGRIAVPLSWVDMRASPTVISATGPGFSSGNVSTDNLQVYNGSGGRYEIVAAAANLDTFVIDRVFRLSAEL